MMYFKMNRIKGILDFSLRMFYSYWRSSSLNDFAFSFFDPWFKKFKNFKTEHKKTWRERSFYMRINGSLYFSMLRIRFDMSKKNFYIRISIYDISHTQSISYSHLRNSSTSWRSSWFFSSFCSFSVRFKSSKISKFLWVKISKFISWKAYITSSI